MPALVSNSPSDGIDARQALALGQLAHRRAGHDARHPGPRTSSSSTRAKRLAQKPLDAVALNRSTDLTRDRKPQAEGAPPPELGKL